MTETSWLVYAYVAAGMLCTIALAGVAIGGWDYYALPVAARPLHENHALLRSSGTVGLSCGVAGTGLFFLNLTYLVRKRLAGVAWLGSLRSWMLFHVLSGLTGTGLIVLHCAFLPRSSLGILALASLAVVVVTGLVGRYVYAHVPRSVEGRELESEELRQRLATHRAGLEALGLDARLLDERPDTLPHAGRGLLARIAGVAAGDRSIRSDYRRLKRTLRNESLAALAPQILPLARRFCRDRQWLARYGELRSLMSAWRFLHRWLAILMFVLAIFHIALAVRFGDLWLFREWS